MYDFRQALKRQLTQPQSEDPNTACRSLRSLTPSFPLKYLCKLIRPHQRGTISFVPSSKPLNQTPPRFNVNDNYPHPAEKQTAREETRKKKHQSLLFSMQAPRFPVSALSCYLSPISFRPLSNPRDVPIDDRNRGACRAFSPQDSCFLSPPPRWRQALCRRCSDVAGVAHPHLPPEDRWEQAQDKRH